MNTHLMLYRMRRANRLRRFARGRWTQAEIDDIQRRAKEMAEAMAPFID